MAAEDRSGSDNWVDEHRWANTPTEVFSKWQEDRVEVLKTVPLFSGLSRRHLNQVARYVAEKEVEAGAVLANQGRTESEFMLVLSGTAKVERDGHDIAQLKAGDFFGEMSLIDGEPRSATVTAETACLLMVIDRDPFDKLLDSVPEMQKLITLALCKRLREADSALAALN